MPGRNTGSEKALPWIWVNRISEWPLLSGAVPVITQWPDTGQETDRPVVGGTKPSGSPWSQLPDTSAAQNECGVPPSVVYSPATVQFCGDPQDTELTSANSPVLSCGMSPTSWNGPQVPFTSSSTNACRWLDASRYQPATAQLPADGHDTDRACELEVPTPGRIIACCHVPPSSTSTVARSLNWSADVSPT